MNLPAIRLIFEVLDKATAPIRGIQARLAMMSKQSRQNLQKVGQTVNRAGMLMAAATGAVVAASVAQRGATMDALNALESLGVKKLENLRQAAVDFSDEWSGTTRNEFLAAAYDIKSGIDGLSDEGVAATTTVAALTAKATRGTAKELARTFATGHGIFRKFFESDEEFAEQFGAGIAAATKAFKTDGGRMARAISSLGAEAASANVPLAEQIAVLGMLQQTMEASEAGTSYKALMASLGKVTDVHGQRLVDAAGNALPMIEVLKKIQNYLDGAEDKGKAWQEVTKAFGREEAVKVLKLLIERQEELGRKIEFVGQAAKKGKQYIEAMAAVQNKGEGSVWKKIGQSISNLAGAIGKALSPLLLPLMEKFQKLVERTRLWVEANPKLARTIIMIAGALSVAAVAVGTFTVAMAGLSLVAWTNPVTWIAAGITAAVLAIIAAGVALYVYWDKVTAWWSGLWDEWGGAITAAFPLIVVPIRAMAALKDWLVANWQDIGPFFKNLWDGIVQAVLGPVRWIYRVLKAVIKKIIDTYKSLFSLLPESAQNWIKQKIGLKVAVDAESAPSAAQAAAQAARTQKAVADASAAARGDRKEKSEIRMKMEFSNVPRGAIITQLDKRGDADVNIDAGLAYAP